MYKTKGVEPNTRVEGNKSTSKTLNVLTQYNPQTLFEPLILSFIAPLTPGHVTSLLKPMWIKE